MKKRKGFWKLLSLSFLVAVVLTVGTEAQATAGTGTSADPYVVQDVTDLYKMYQDLDGHFILANDLYLDEYLWTPVGNEKTGAFTGSLDGQGHTIYGLTIQQPESKYAGLFGYMEGTVKNLTLKEVSVTGGRYVGAIAGSAGVGSAVSDCHVDSGTVYSPGGLISVSVGGLVGEYTGEMVNCSNGAEVKATIQNPNGYLGGLVGSSSETLTLKNCSNTGRLTLQHGLADTAGEVGGLVGHAAGNFISMGCKNNGAVIAEKSIETNYLVNVPKCAGGLLGGTNGYIEIIIKDCVNGGPIEVGRYCGGLIGYVGAYNVVDISSCQNTGSLGPGRNAFNDSGGGMIGYIGARNLVYIDDCINFGNLYCGYAGGILGYIDMYSNTCITSCENRGSSTSGIVGYINFKNELLLKACWNKGENKSNAMCGVASSSTSGFESDITLVDCGNSADQPNVPVSNYQSHPYYIIENYVDQSISGTVIDASVCVGEYETVYSFGQLFISTGGIKLYLDGKDNKGTYYCTDLRYPGYSGYFHIGYSLADLQNPTTYQDLDMSGWIIDPSKNSGLPMPADCKVHYMDKTVLILEKGETDKVTPPFQAVSWDSSDKTVARCENGTVTATNVGTSVISAWDADLNRSNCVVYVYEPRKSVSLSAEDVELTVGKTSTLTTDLPAEDPQGIIWSSSNPEVATVAQTGVVTAKGIGTAEITAYLPLSGVSATCTVTTNAPVTSLSLSSSTINVGGTAKLNYTVTPAAYTGTLTWTSSDENVLTVENGIATGRKVGSAAVTVTSDTGVSRTAIITVKQPCQTLSLDRTAVNLEIGYTDQLVATMTPADCTDTITWTSSSTSIVTVSSTGVLTPNRVGQAVITAKATSGVMATCVVTVKATPVLPTSVTLNQTVLRPVVGEKVTLTASVLPTNATDKTVTWTSSDPQVAAVTSTGVVEALAPGFAEIYATTANGLYDVCQVAVSQVSSAAFVLTDNRIQLGAQADTEVHITKNPGISAFSVDVVYDAEMLIPVEITAGEILDTGTLSSNIETAAKDGYLTVTWYSDEDMTEDGLAFTVTWKCGDTVATVPVSLSFADSDICNSEKLEVGFSVEKGDMEIVDYLVGDIYPDDLLNMKDIVYFARWFNGQEKLTDKQQKCADLHYDKALDVKDLTTLAQLLNESLEEQLWSGFSMSLRSLVEEEPYKIAISNGEVDENGDVLLSVVGSDCPGVAAFRFELKIPEGFDVVEVLPGNDLPEIGSFLYNEETRIVSWYWDTSAELNGTLFTILLHTDVALEQPAIVAMNYVKSDFFSADTFENVAISVGTGEIRVAQAIDMGQPEFSKGKICFEIHSTEDAKGNLIAAYYESNGKLMTTQSYSITTVPGSKEYSVEPPNGWNTCKLFLLDAENYNPLCSAVEISNK